MQFGRVHARTLLLSTCGALMAAALLLPAHLNARDTPFAGGDDAANIPLNSASKAVVVRWVADHTGLLQRLYFRVRVEGAPCKPGRSGYALGSTGRMQVATYRVLPDGRPDTNARMAIEEFVPCARQKEESVDVNLGFYVTKGAEYATVVRNVDPNPSANFFSTNYLFAAEGVAGANGRNERNPNATDSYYGRDPRELVGYTTDGGANWSLPGGPYGGQGGRAFIPTYVQEYADGFRGGQPYYWAGGTSSSVTMVFPNVPVAWTINQLGAYTTGSGSGTLRLLVNGSQRAQANLSGRGMLRAAIAPVTVAPGSTVKVQSSGGLQLMQVHPDKLWAGISRLGTGSRFYREGSPNNVVPIYPIPMYQTEGNVWPTAPAPPVVKKKAKRCKVVRRTTVRSKSGRLLRVVRVNCCAPKRVKVRTKSGKVKTVVRRKCTRVVRRIPVRTSARTTEYLPRS